MLRFTIALAVALAVSRAVSAPFLLTDADASRPFAGVGGISGGGATSRTLFDYPEPQRTKLLDLLFLPQYGAALQQAKVEIPADADTTCGSEVAHRHDAADGGSCTRGYEGWFLSEATKRAEGGVMTTSSLQWAAPAFVREPGVSDGKSLFTRTNVDEYVIPWLRCMRDSYNVSLTYQGAGWNEKPFNATYIKLMRSLLDGAGMGGIGLAAADQCCGGQWGVVRAMGDDAGLKSSIAVISTHCAGSLEGNFATPPEAIALGIPLSQGEEHIGMPDPDSVPVWDWAGAASIGIQVSQNWLMNNMTSTVYWPAIYAWSSGLIYRGKGLLVATSPWAETPPFFIPPALWVVAQTTHFTRANGDWQLLSGTGSGHLGDGFTPGKGYPGGWNVSYVTYVSTRDAGCAQNACPFTLVVESFFAGGVYHTSAHPTTNAAAITTGSFLLGGRLASWAGKSLHAWHTNATAQFVHEADVPVGVDGSFSISIEDSAIWTFTTVESAHPGAAAIIASLAPIGGASTDGSPPDGPLDAPFPLPFADDFEGYGNDTLPLYTSDMFGAFTVYELPAGAATPLPLRSHHPDAAVRASVACSSEADARRYPTRCILPPRDASGSNTRVLRQWTRAPPLGWGGDSSNMATLIGNSTLSNIHVDVSVLVETVDAGYEPPQAPYILVGIHGGGASPGSSSPRSFYRTGPDFDFVWVSPVSNTWGCSISGGPTMCDASHPLPTPFPLDTWHNVSLEGMTLRGGDVRFSIMWDGALLGNATVAAADVKNGGRGGYVGLVTGAHRVQWDNLLIRSA